MAEHRGLFVTVDGPSGVGKTTVCALIKHKLESRDLQVVLTATPSSSKIGQLARYGTYDFHGIALTCLVAADRYHHERTTVRPSIEQGAVVVCDRYVPSSLVLDPLDGVERDFVLGVYQHIAVPDIAFVLIGDSSLCAARAASRGRYSRFQATDAEGNRQELAMFHEAFGVPAPRWLPRARAQYRSSHGRRSSGCPHQRHP
jgi:dTMP kinase